MKNNLLENLIIGIIGIYQKMEFAIMPLILSCI